MQCDNALSNNNASRDNASLCKDLLLHIRINHCIAHFKQTDQPSFWHPNQQIRNNDGREQKNGLEPNEYGLADLLSPLPWLP